MRVELYRTVYWDPKRPSVARATIDAGFVSMTIPLTIDCECEPMTILLPEDALVYSYLNEDGLRVLLLTDREPEEDREWEPEPEWEEIT